MFIKKARNPRALLGCQQPAERCTDPALPCTFLPSGAQALLRDGSFIDCTDIGSLFSCSSQILLIWIIQTDVKCFSKMENSCAFFLFLFGPVLAWGGLSGLGASWGRGLARLGGRAGEVSMVGRVLSAGSTALLPASFDPVPLGLQLLVGGTRGGGPWQSLGLLWLMGVDRSTSLVSLPAVVWPSCPAGVPHRLEAQRAVALAGLSIFPHALLLLPGG